MSLLYVEQRVTLSFGIWHITEHESILETLSGCSAPAHVTNSARRLEYLAIRSLAKAMGISPSHIDYHPSGKPFLKDDSRAISLSHTKHYAALLVGENPLIGIDIEQRSNRVERVRHKFMHPLEEAALEAAGLDTSTGLLVHWCAKEAVFKAVPEKDIDFVGEIRVTHLPTIRPIPTVTEITKVTKIETQQPSTAITGKVTFLRTHTSFQLEAWSSPDFVLVICH